MFSKCKLRMNTKICDHCDEDYEDIIISTCTRSMVDIIFFIQYRIIEEREKNSRRWRGQTWKR